MSAPLQLFLFSIYYIFAIAVMTTTQKLQFREYSEFRLHLSS